MRLQFRRRPADDQGMTRTSIALDALDAAWRAAVAAAAWLQARWWPSDGGGGVADRAAIAPAAVVWKLARGLVACRGALGAAGGHGAGSRLLNFGCRKLK